MYQRDLEINPENINIILNYKIILPQAGVEPAFFRLEVGRDIHFATKVVYYTTKSLNEEYVIEFKMAILCAWTRARSSTFSMAFS